MERERVIAIFCVGWQYKVPPEKNTCKPGQCKYNKNTEREMKAVIPVLLCVEYSMVAQSSPLVWGI